MDPSHPVSILIVDDDQELLRLLLTAFREAGYQAHGAADGEEGLALFEVVRPQAVLMDLIMPVREGFETLMAMKAAAPEVKVVIMSGGWRHGPGVFLDLARHLGAEAGLAKPFRPSQAVGLLNTILAGVPGGPSGRAQDMTARSATAQPGGAGRAGPSVPARTSGLRGAARG